MFKAILTTVSKLFTSHLLTLLAWSRVYVTAGCPSVPLFARRTALLRVCCCSPDVQEIRSLAAAAPQHGAQQQMLPVLRCQLTYEAEHRLVILGLHWSTC